MPVDNINLFANDNIAKDGKEREDGRKCSFSVYDKEGDMIYFEAVGQISDTGTACIGVSNYDNFVAAVDQFLRGCERYVKPQTKGENIQWIIGRCDSRHLLPHYVRMYLHMIEAFFESDLAVERRSR